MDQHTEVVDVSDNGGGGGGRPPFYLSRRDFIPTLRFSLQRANSRIRNADSKRRNARNGRKYASGTRSFQAAVYESVTILKNNILFFNIIKG